MLAGTPQLLSDINPSGSSSPAEFVAVGSTVFFSATDATNGRELWKSNGSTSGTWLVKDINPTGSSAPASLTAVNGLLFFTATDGVHGVELWKTDGTQAGTVQVKDINPTGSSSPSSLINMNGVLYFSADDGVHGAELWKSDGTDAGTVMVKDINPNGSVGSAPTYLTSANGTLFFRADDGVHGKELWTSNGTDAGTVLVKDIVPGPDSSTPGYLHSITGAGGNLFFSAFDPAHGFELWKTNGTASGTVLVKDINPGTANSWPLVMTNVNGTLYMSATDGVHGFELWKSDGTDAGTVMVKDIDTTSSSYGSGPDNLTNVGGTLYFTASLSGTGRELWKSDGTTNGTVMVKDIASGSVSSNPRNLVNVSGTLYFTANDSNGAELWQSDGTATGTAIVSNIGPGTASSTPSNLMAINGTLFFAADNGTNGVEPWVARGASSVVLAPQLFYNNSKYDANNPAATVEDFAAIATDKVAYIGGTALSTFANVSNFSRGINGLIIDLPAPHGTITASDFTFRIGNNNSPSSWSAAPQPLSVTTFAGAGANRTDRISIIWADNVIQQTWLQVTIAGSTNTGLSSAFTFYFASAIADSGSGNSTAAVTNIADENAARNNPAGVLSHIPVTNAFDFNRDGKVDVTDQSLARMFANTSLTAAKFLNLPADSSPPAGAAIALSVATDTHPQAAPVTADATTLVLATDLPPKGPADISRARGKTSDSGAGPLSTAERDSEGMDLSGQRAAAVDIVMQTDLFAQWRR